MDDSHFDDLTRFLAVPSRRSLFAAVATAIGAALFGDDANDEALAKRNKRAKHKQAKREHAKTRRRANHDRLEAEGRKNKKKKKKKKRPAATAPPTGYGSPLPPSCVPSCTSKACGAPDGCSGTCQTGSCPGEQVCQRGHCVLSCDAGFTLCGSQCVHTQTNANHCGGCNQSCAVQAPETCGTNGQCVGGVCQKYGTETVCRHESCLDSETLLSQARCGGGRCASSFSQDCRPGQCSPHTQRCQDGCFEHTGCSSDGWCDGNRCHFKRGNGQPCSASTPQMCTSGFCVDGVCCGSACNTPPNAQRTCAGGTCAFSCTPGFGNCDGDWSNGCEADLSTHEQHCGGCHQPCGGDHARGSCTSGTCTLICDAGWGNCDTDLANGCETDLTTTMNCGQCGNNCTSQCTPKPGECHFFDGTYQCVCTG